MLVYAWGLILRKIVKFVAQNGNEPFSEWFSTLDRRAQAKARAYVDRVALGGSLKNVKPVGDGVYEIKIDYGPGYRIYFGLIKKTIMLLLMAGDKSNQSKDIGQAQEYWRTTRETT